MKRTLPPPVVRTQPENNLIAALTARERATVLAALEPVELVFADVLYEPGQPIHHVYFPGNALVSLLTLVDGHLELEVGLVGCEGMVGLPVVLGHDKSYVRALVQGGGRALRMATAPFRRLCRESPGLQKQMLLFAQSLIAQISQTAACNRFHVVDQRLARWLLMTRDRVKSDQFGMTHEFLAHMLGVRRVGVTRSAHALQQEGLISYTRGQITITDAAGLEAASCTCYRVIRDMHEPKSTPGSP